jgi:hypothetical protein
MRYEQKMGTINSTRLEKNVVLSGIQGLISFHIADPSVTWKTLFATMEELKNLKPNLVDDYSVGETTLEQIFLAFARSQRADAARYETKCWTCCAGKNENEDVSEIYEPSNVQAT